MIGNNMRRILTISLMFVLISGCRSDASSAKESGTKSENVALLEQLTSTREAERFKSLNSALSGLEKINVEELESALEALRPKNLSTLIYAYIKSGNTTLYTVGLPSKKVLEGSPGSFPNIAYYYARVDSQKGIEELQRLYQQNPDKRMDICKAIGEVPGESGYVFLLSEAKSEKKSGKSILNHLAGLKRSSSESDTKDLLWFLEQDLDREELIALSQLKSRFTEDQLQALWMEGGRKKAFATEVVLGDSPKYFETLKWIIEQYTNAGQTELVRQILMSDSMRKVTDSKVAQYREEMLKN